MRYTKVFVCINTQKQPPYFIGSQLRGAFGYALKKVVCINPAYSCENCFSQQNCLFYDFYEKSNLVHPYRFDISLAQDTYTYGFYLFEEACQKLPYILSAFHMMLTNFGLGKEKSCFDTFRFYVNDVLVYDAGEFMLPKEFIQNFSFAQKSSTVLVKLRTPLRIKKHGKFVRDNSFEAKELLLSIQKRALLLQGKKEKAYIQNDFKTLHKELYFKDLTRYSNPQKSKLQIGGLLGEFILTNLSQEHFKTLKVGELIGAGKQCVFGLGKLEVKEIDASI